MVPTSMRKSSAKDSYSFENKRKQPGRLAAIRPHAAAFRVRKNAVFRPTHPHSHECATTKSRPGIAQRRRDQARGAGTLPPLSCTRPPCRPSSLYDQDSRNSKAGPAVACTLKAQTGWRTAPQHCPHFVTGRNACRSRPPRRGNLLRQSPATH